MPVSILKTGDIAFNPALPSSKLAALENLEMDSSLRVLLDFKMNFWGSSSGFLYGGAASPEYLNAGIGRSESSKTLSLTVNGSKAAEFSALGKDVIPMLLDEMDSVGWKLSEDERSRLSREGPCRLLKSPEKRALINAEFIETSCLIRVHRRPSVADCVLHLERGPIALAD